MKILIFIFQDCFLQTTNPIDVFTQFNRYFVKAEEYLNKKFKSGSSLIIMNQNRYYRLCS